MYTRSRSFESPPVHQHTRETFSRNWHVDVQQVFNWTSALSSSELIDGAHRMRRSGIPATNPIGAAITDELFRRERAALQSVTAPDWPDYTARPERTAS